MLVPIHMSFLGCLNKVLQMGWLKNNKNSLPYSYGG